ncbi:MAG: type II toxin-antitoxin system RelE/ParE family toxin [Nitrospira sp.]|nr:type II toxin-antitoxin system RelE/ParE family toxin [Nitrospira sp.]
MLPGPGFPLRPPTSVKGNSRTTETNSQIAFIDQRREVVWTASPRNELDDIVVYIAKDAPLSALAFLEEVLAIADTLVTLAKRGRMVPDSKTQPSFGSPSAAALYTDGL